MTSRKFQKMIWDWYRDYTPGRAGRPNLPWRETKDAYNIFVSEVMLQQTQIPRVIEKYFSFLKKFPTVNVLAQSSLSEVLTEWQGLGYNRRGKYLWEAARMVESLHGGIFPNNVDDLVALPGIGRYSAGAIICFSYGVCEPFIETNIRRVIIHHFFLDKKQVSDTEIMNILKKVEPKDPATHRDWYYALMDYGRDALKHIPNPNRKSKHYSKQTPFLGSRRYMRAKILAYVLEHSSSHITLAMLTDMIKKDPLSNKRLLSEVETIVVDLINEEFLTQDPFIRVP